MLISRCHGELLEFLCTDDTSYYICSKCGYPSDIFTTNDNKENKMEITQLKKLQDDLFHDEGYRQFVYKDTKNIPTVGIGRNLENKGISIEEAYYLCSNDITECWKNLLKNWPFLDKLDAVRQNVIINMAFNLGIKGISKFKNMFEHLNDSNYLGASKEIINSEAAKELSLRYARLANEMETGEHVVRGNREGS